MPHAAVEDVGVLEFREQHDLLCPRCGAMMKLKMSSKHGKYFYGCKAYPRCEEARDADEQGSPLASNFGVPTSALRQKPAPATVWSILMSDED